MSAAAAPSPSATPVTRREFLYYIWGASMALFLAETGGVTLWFALPRFKAGEFGGTFDLEVAQVPAVDAPPKDFPDGRFWLVNLGPKALADTRQPKDYPIEPGVAAIYKVCVHLGCLYKWVPTNDRFECPCHGSKYLATGARVDGPATRNLDKFVLEALDKDGKTLAKTEAPEGGEGKPLVLPQGTVTIRINTGKKIQGAANTRPGGGK